MKKRLALLICGVLASAVVLSGCQASKGLKTDDIEITQYNGVEVEAVDKPEDITDEDVENYLNSLLAGSAETTAVTDRAVQKGDIVDIKFVGTIDGEEFSGGSSDSTSVTIGSGQMIDGFEDSIIGHATGETFVWDGSFPENYSATDYAGKACQFTITVNSISVQTVPELTDEWVKTQSETATTVDEYKKELKAELEQDNENTYQSSLQSAVWNVVMANATVKNYDQDALDEEKESWVSQYKEYAQSMGMEYEDFIEQMGQMTVEEFEESMEESLKEYQKRGLVLKAIAEKEKIVINDDNYEEKLQLLVDSTGIDAETLQADYERDVLEEAILDILVKEWLVKHCVQVSK